MEKHLGSIDKEWLKYVLEAPGQKEYAVFWEGEMVGEVGITLPETDFPYFAITNIAVNPDFQRKGLGSQILTDLMTLHLANNETGWISNVHRSNQFAQTFFEKNGWQKAYEDEDGMISYIFKGL